MMRTTVTGGFTVLMSVGVPDGTDPQTMLDSMLDRIMDQFDLDMDKHGLADEFISDYEVIESEDGPRIIIGISQDSVQEDSYESYVATCLQEAKIWTDELSGEFDALTAVFDMKVWNSSEDTYEDDDADCGAYEDRRSD